MPSWKIFAFSKANCIGLIGVTGALVRSCAISIATRFGPEGIFMTAVSHFVGRFALKAYFTGIKKP